MNELSVPVSFGELIDKITILEIKSERVTAAPALVKLIQAKDTDAVTRVEAVSALGTIHSPSVADIDAVATAWGVLGLGAIHVLVAAVAETGRAASRWVPPALLTVHASGVLLIGVIWQFAGALQNPKQDQRRQIGSQPAKEGTDRE